MFALFAWIATSRMFFPGSLADTAERQTECDRGVKRHHPSQANIYQVFTRQDHQKQWLDNTCPEYTIFDPRQCTCVESPRRQPKKDGPSGPMTQRRRKGIQRGNQRNGMNRPTPSDREMEQDTTDEPKPRYGSAKRKSQQKNQGGYDGMSSQQNQRPSNNKYVGDDDMETRDWDQQERKTKVGRASMDVDTRDRMSLDNTQSQDMDTADSGDTMDTTHIGDTMDTETSKQGGQDCYLHRQSSADQSHFERWTDGQWEEEDCNWPFYAGLVWNQDTCRCVPAQCLMMLKVTFDKGEIKDEGRHIWLNVHNKKQAKVQIDKTAIGGYSGDFRGASIAVPYFKSNLLGAVFHIGFMYQLCPGEPDTDIPFLHNDCVESQDGPSIVVTYQAWKKQVTVSMRTEDSMLISESCLINKAQNEWTKLDIRYEDSFLEVMADDKVCIESDMFYGPLATNNCPLTLLDESFCGNLDQVIITRGCTQAHAVS